MESPLPKHILVVFTSRSIERILAVGGSQAWALKPDNARRCYYLVCTRNRFQDDSGPETHGAAFLVGKISAVVPSLENPERFIVRISEYALIDPPLPVWRGARNPVWYVDTLAELNIDESALQWLPMAEQVNQAAAVSDTGTARSDKLTIAAAKTALAATFGVTPENIEIIIRA